MRDPRIDKLARVLVHYSTKVRKGQLVRLTSSPEAMPLLEAIYEQCIDAGAHVLFDCAPEQFTDIFFERASKDQLRYVNPITKYAMKQIDVAISIKATTNTKSQTNVDPKKQALASTARKPLVKTFFNRAAEGSLKWVTTLYPTPSGAQNASMSLRDYEEFVFNAGHLDKDDPVAEWKKIAKRQQKLTDYLNKDSKEVRFQTANGTDLTVNVEDMTWINCFGDCNFPDGEVFTGPNLKAKDGGVNGVVKYSFPACHMGREVNDIELTFEKGKVVQAKSSNDLAFLKKMLALDPGASRVGEVAIGTNYQIQQYTKNTLFDEKIGGTFHLAVGAGYPESGNSNQSGLHWDMVCDMRFGGSITVDGKVISRDGVFTNKTWPSM